MKKELITDKQAIFILIAFLIGSTLIIGVGGDAKNDAWISGIISILIFLPLLFIYSRISSLYHGKDIFEILNILFGKIAGRIIGIIYILYSFHLGALVLRNFGEFVNTVAMPETPMLVSLLSLGFVCIIAVRLGIEVIGRTTTYFLPLIFFILIFVQILGMPKLHFNYLKPVFVANGIIPILRGAFSAFSFPFAETVIFLGVFSSLKTKKSHLKVYLWGILIAGFMIILLTIRNIAVLGNMLGSFYFPSYEAVSRTELGSFIQRIEVSVAVVFNFGVFIKSAICLLVTCKGISTMFNLKSYRSIAVQTGLLMIYFSYIIYDNIVQMQYWAFKVYQYYAFPMQVILPIIIWVIAEVKSKKKQQQS
jgi:spore germination protein KB